MNEQLNRFFRGQIVTSLLYLLFGICLAFMPVGTVNVLCKVIFGLVLMAAGLYHIFIFAAEKENATLLDLFSGVIVFVIGLFLFQNPQIVVKLMPMMLGALVLVDSIWTIRGGWRLKKQGQDSWKFFLIESLAFVVTGVILMTYSFQNVRSMLLFAGLIFLADGVLDLVSYVILKQAMKEPKAKAEDKKGEASEPVREEAGEEKEEPGQPEEVIPEWNSRPIPGGEEPSAQTEENAAQEPVPESFENTEPEAEEAHAAAEAFAGEEFPAAEEAETNSAISLSGEAAEEKEEP